MSLENWSRKMGNRSCVNPLYSAYWICPEGDIVPVPFRHIVTVSENPERFGVTAEEIKERYVFYREKPGLEGNARQDILLKVLKRGWIRIREEQKYDVWKCQCWVFDEQAKQLIADWITQMSLVEKHFQYKTLKILHTEKQERLTMSIQEFLQDSYSGIP